MEAIVLAGGFGTRLAHVVKDVPKPMAPVAGAPFLKYVLDDLVEQGVSRVVLAVCFKKEIIMDFFGNNYRGAEVVYSVEETPLLTGGAIKQGLTFCEDERVLVINGDTYFQTDLKSMRSLSEKVNGKITISVKEMFDFSRYGTVEITDSMEVVSFREKQLCARGYINGGIYDVKRDSLKNYPEKFSMENDCFPEMLKKHDIYAFKSDGFFIDIGIPEDYFKAQEIFRGK